MKFRASKHLIRVWLACIRASIIREMEFRRNFILDVSRNLLWFGIFLLFIDIIFRNTQSLSGWAKEDMLVILALSRLIEGVIGALFVQNIMMLPTTVQNGDFDYYLTKPLPAQFYMAFRFFKLESIGSVLSGIALLAYALPNISHAISSFDAFTFFAVAIVGIATYYSLLILVASLVFWFERLDALWGFNALFSEPLTVPFDIFPQKIQLFLTYFLPLALVVFVPAQALTGRLESGAFLFQATALAALLFCFSQWAWKQGLQKYSSASS